MIDRETLQKAEPNLNTENVLGAAYTIEGMVDPLKVYSCLCRGGRAPGHNPSPEFGGYRDGRP